MPKTKSPIGAAKLRSPMGDTKIKRGGAKIGGSKKR